MVPSGLDTTRDQWEAAYRELVLSPMALIQPTIRAMSERGFGRVLNISSSAVHEPIPGLLLVDRTPQRPAGHVQAALAGGCRKTA